MKDFTIIDALGEPIRFLGLSDPEQITHNVQEGESFVVGQPSVPSYWSGSDWIAKPASPASDYVWNTAEKVWYDPRTLAQVQDAQCSLIDAAYISAISQPVSFTTAGAVTKTFDADTQSAATLQSTLVGLSALQTVPSGFFWLSHDNTPVPFTFPDLQGLAAAMLTQGWVAFQNRTAKKAAIRAATTIADVITITF